MSISTTFAANDLYNKTFYAFMIALGVLFALIILMACLYRLQKKAHGSVLQTKRDLKRMNLQKEYKDQNKPQDSYVDIDMDDKEVVFSDDE